jgi:hypothetical protein
MGNHEGKTVFLETMVQVSGLRKSFTDKRYVMD